MNDVIYESNLDTALGTVSRWHCCRTHLRGEKKAISRLINLIFSLLLAVGRISELSQLLPFTTAPSLEKSQSTIHPTSPKKQYFEQLNPFLQAAKRSDFLFQNAPAHYDPHLIATARFMANLNWLLIRRKDTRWRRFNIYFTTFWWKSTRETLTNNWKSVCVWSFRVSLRRAITVGMSVLSHYNALKLEGKVEKSPTKVI